MGHMPMPLISIVFGFLLILQGLGFLMASDTGSWTPAIPAIPGALFVLLGFIALCAPPLRKHAMHVVMLIAMLGIVAGLMRSVPALGADAAPPTKVASLMQDNDMSEVAARASLETTHWAKIWDQLMLSGLCAVLLGLGVCSFVQARRSGASGSEGA